MLAGLLWPWVGKPPYGRLSGDITIDKLGFRLYFPITTMIIIIVVISVILWLFRK